MAHPESEDAMREAMSRVVDAHDPVMRGRLLRQVIDRAVDDDDSLSDVVDLIMSLDDTMRQQTKADIMQYLKEHPGTWSQKNDDDLRRAIASDPTFPKPLFSRDP